MNFKELYGKKTLIFDGAMGTMLQSRNLVTAGCTDLLSLTSPAQLTAIHAEYVSAGANIITTNTFGANICKLSSFGLSDKMWDINVAAVKAARDACDGSTFVAGDIGPTGRVLQPFGDLSPLDAYDAYFKQSLALAEGGVDLIIIETMSDLREARIAYMAAREATQLPVIVSFTFENGRTLMGNPPSVIASLMTAMKADGIGANCSGGPDEINAIVSKYIKYTDLPITAQPNAGMPVLERNSIVYPLDSTSFFDAMFSLADKCACIGGCCGTTPKHIKELRAYVHPLFSRPVVPEKCLVNPRKTFSVDTINNAATIKLSEDDILDKIMDCDADSVIIDIDCKMSRIKDQLAAIQAYYFKPYIFRSDSFEALNYALFDYCGICGFMFDGSNEDEKNTLIRKYGAIPV